MQITFAGTAPPSHSDRGNLNAVDFQAQALSGTPFSSFFRDMTGKGLVKGKHVNSTLNDFRVNLTDGGVIHFLGGAFTGNGQEIAGIFSISKGVDNRSNGAWDVTPVNG